MTDILEEIKNSDRYQKNLYFYKKFIVFTVIISMVAILAMMFINKRNAKLQHQKEKMTSVLIKSMQNKNKQSTEVIKELESLLLDSNMRIKEIAHIELLGDNIRSGNLTEAKNIARQIISMKDYNEITRAYARLNLIAISIENTKNRYSDISDHNKDDKVFIDELFSEFSTTNPFWGIAALYCAVWNHKNGNDGEAIQQLEAIISSKYASYNTKDYAKQLKQAYEARITS